MTPLSIEALRRLVGSVQDPHLPFGLGDLGMLERVELADSGDVSVVVNMPCHHCPGLLMIEQDIRDALQRAGVTENIFVSFQGREDWTVARIAPEARVAMQAMGIQSIVPSDCINAEEPV